MICGLRLMGEGNMCGDVGEGMGLLWVNVNVVDHVRAE